MFISQLGQRSREKLTSRAFAPSSRARAHQGSPRHRQQLGRVQRVAVVAEAGDLVAAADARSTRHPLHFRASPGLSAIPEGPRSVLGGELRAYPNRYSCPSGPISPVIGTATAVGGGAENFIPDRGVSAGESFGSGTM